MLYLLRQHDFIIYDLFQCRDRDVYALFHTDVFTKRQALHRKDQYSSGEICCTFINIKHRRTGKYHLQGWRIIVYHLKFCSPSLIFMYFIDKKMLASKLAKL